MSSTTGVASLRLRHSRGETVVLAGSGALREARPLMTRWVSGRRVFVVTTPRVAGLHLDSVTPCLRGAAGVIRLEVAEGEAAKTLTEAEGLWTRMVQAGGKRDSRVIAVGGGAVGDLGGFVAGCYLRGIPFAQVPTTLLAQVDAAIGGKTGIDLPSAKNSVGLFHHPHLVIADTEVLATLERGEIAAGLYEVVKTAAMLDAELFGRLEDRLDELLEGDGAALGPVVAATAAAKIAVVEQDPEEADRRRLLNFGHTLGHTLETVGSYRRLRHGEAVGLGMLFALRLAERRGLDAPSADRIRRLVLRLRPPAPPPCEVEELLVLMGRDKKAREGGLAWVVPQAIGRGVVLEDVKRDEVAGLLAEFLDEASSGPGPV